MTTDSKSKLFSISLFFRGVHNKTPSEDDVWEESIILILAFDEITAKEKAIKIGKSKEVSYEVSDKDTLCWTFSQVERVYEILDKEIGDGVEIFSRFYRNHEINSIFQPFDD
jgi:hypothetical protein